MEWIGKINRCIENDKFILYYQPIVPLIPEKGYTPKVEILLRLVNEDGSISRPGDFIPAAERYNLMPGLDRWVIDAALRQMNLWHRSGRPLPFGQLSINLSGASLDDTDLPRYLTEKVAEHGVDPRRLCIEITESCAVANPERALEFVDMIRGMGIALSLDDFGNGLSSFGYLKRFKADYLKIDGQFVCNLEHDATDRAVVEAMVSLARAHNLRTIAEFVATPALIETVASLGVDYAQGFAVHLPAPLSEV
jgi:EAL domain-containing protein (putative c-di-GMP-specific phosphodiesterase class I)